MKPIIFFLVLQILLACGGSGSGNTDQVNNPLSAEPQPDTDSDGVPDASDAFPMDPNETEDTNGDGLGNNAEFTSDYFAVVYGAFDSVLTNDAPFGNGGPAVPGVMKVFDRNNDGFIDVLYTNFIFRFGYDGFEKSYDYLNYFENDGAGNFVNRTLEIFGDFTFGAAIRKVSFADINDDEIVDIAFANNLEDGRSAAENNTNILAANSVFISQTDGTYSRSLVGDPAWSHHVELIDFDLDGNIELLDGNYSFGAKIYDLNPDGSWVDTTSDIPEVLGMREIFDANDNTLGDFNDDGCVDAVTTRRYPEVQDKSYFVGNCQGAFTLIQHLPFGEEVSFMPGISWSGEDSMFKVAEIDGELFAGLTNFWSLTDDFDNDGDIDVLYTTDTFKVTEEEKANNFVIEGGELITHLTLLRNTPEGFEKVRALTNHLPKGSGIFLAESADLNGDGFVDLVIDDHGTWQNNYKMHDYLHFNNGDGTFSQNVREFATGLFIDKYRNVVPLDFNNDGITDFILRNNACPGCIGDLVLIKGLKALER